MGTSALRSHLNINHLGPDPGSTCPVLSLNDTGTVRVPAKSWRRMRVMSNSSSCFFGAGSCRQSGALPGAAGQVPAGVS